MIAAESQTRRPRLFRICRVKYCRSVATETLLKNGKPFWCQKHLTWALNLPPDKP